VCPEDEGKGYSMPSPAAKLGSKLVRNLYGNTPEDRPHAQRWDGFLRQSEADFDPQAGSMAR